MDAVEKDILLMPNEIGIFNEICFPQETLSLTPDLPLHLISIRLETDALIPQGSFIIKNFITLIVSPHLKLHGY